LSRIIHGPSPEIRAMRATVRPKEAVAVKMDTFQTFVTEGTLSQEEMDHHLAQARAAGQQEAEARIIAPLNAALQNIEHVLDELSQFRRELFKESEADILELVQAIAKRVCMKELSIAPEMMKEIVAKAISLLERQKKVSLQINSADFEFYSRAKPDFIQRFKGLEELDITVSPDVAPGTVSVRSKSLELDVRLEAMVDHMLSQIKSSKTEVNQANNDGDSI
jgi:flagellar biosynthesis/type III secretory pathway protein FliH